MSYSKSVLVVEAIVLVSLYLFFCLCTYIGIDLLINPIDPIQNIEIVQGWVDLTFIIVYTALCLMPLAVIVFTLEPLVNFLLGLPKKVGFYKTLNNEHKLDNI